MEAGQGTDPTTGTAPDAANAADGFSLTPNVLILAGMILTFVAAITAFAVLHYNSSTDAIGLIGAIIPVVTAVAGIGAGISAGQKSGKSAGRQAQRAETSAKLKDVLASVEAARDAYEQIATTVSTAGTSPPGQASLRLQVAGAGDAELPTAQLDQVRASLESARGALSALA